MPGGIVRSLEIFGANQGMGNRGSKIDSIISVKEQRVDGSSILKKYCKVYSRCQGNLVFLHFIKYVNSIVKSINNCILKFFILNSKDLHFLLKIRLLSLVMLLVIT